MSINQPAGPAPLLDNFMSMQPTVDASFDTRLELDKTEFMGKAMRGAGLGGKDDPLTPFQQDKANVIHINDTNRAAFDDSRGRSVDAALASSGRTSRHDRQLGTLHRMHYDPDPSVGHRQVDRPEYTTGLYEDRLARGTPSQMMKKDTVLPGPADPDSGYRRTVSYKPALFYARPIMRDVHNASLRQVPQRPAQASTMQDLGKSDNALLRTNPTAGTRKKTVLSQVPGSAPVPDNLVAPRAVTRDKNAYTSAVVNDADRNSRLQGVMNAMYDKENALPSERAYYDYYKTSAKSGEKLQSTVVNPIGNDYELVPTGRTRVSGVGSGSQGKHTAHPTHTPVRKAQWSTDSYKRTNLMDAQRVFGQGGTWGFGTNVRASANRGVSSTYRVGGMRRVSGYERPKGQEGVGDIMLAGESTRGGDFQGGKINSVYEGVRQPAHTRSTAASSRTQIGEFGGTKKQLPFDTMVGTRGGELWSKTALLTNAQAPKHMAYYSLRRESGNTAAASDPSAESATAMHSNLSAPGGWQPNPLASHPGSVEDEYGEGPIPRELALSNT